MASVVYWEDLNAPDFNALPDKRRQLWKKARPCYHQPRGVFQHFWLSLQRFITAQSIKTRRQCLPL